MFKNAMKVLMYILAACVIFQISSDQIKAQADNGKDRGVSPSLLPGERYLMINASAFSIEPENADYSKGPSIFYAPAGFSTSQVLYYAPIILRSKTIIKRIDIFAKDDSSENYSMDFRYADESTHVTVINVTSSGASSTARFFRSTRINHKLTGNRMYYLRLRIPPGVSSANFVFLGARLVVAGS